MNDPVGEAKAGIEIGLAMLAEEKLLEAHEYFAIAGRAAEKTGGRAVLEQVRSATFESIALFIYGNYTAALQFAELFYRTAEENGIRQYQLFLSFLTGRIYFELGFYETAELKFSAGRALAQTYDMPDAVRVLSSWHARAVLYGGEADSCAELLEKLDESPEVLFFRAEAYAELGQRDKALEMSERALVYQERERKILPGEYFPWDNGFESVENRAFRRQKGNEVLFRLIRALRSYLRARTVEGYETAVNELYSLTRNDRLSEYDPYNCIYFFYYSEILPRDRDHTRDDRLTVLSKAVKYMQERMSRIEGTADKVAYMNRNIWNARLYRESKANNLV